MTNSVDFAALAASIADELASADAIMGASKADASGAKTLAQGHVISGYAQCIVSINSLMEQGEWTTGRQAGGLSASAAMQKSIIEAAAARGVSKAKAKRLVEKAAGVLAGERAIPSVVKAASVNTTEVARVLFESGIKNEADLVRHVSPPKTDALLSLVKRVTGLDMADRARFVQQIALFEIADDIVTAVGERGAEPPAPTVKVEKVEKVAKPKAEKPKAEPKARPVPKMKDKKKAPPAKDGDAFFA